MRITGGTFNSRKIKTEDFENVKPTLSKTRQGIFNSLSSLIDFSGKSFLDMFSGSGIMSFEAYSRGFSPVFAIEKDKKTAALIRQNFNDFKIPQNLLFGDALRVVTRLERKFDVVFVDPPYESDLYDKALFKIRELSLLTPEGIVVLEHPTSKVIDFQGFEVIKVKEYSDKSITFLN